MAETSIAALDHHTLGRVLEMVCDEATQARLPYVCKQFRDVAISTGLLYQTLSVDLTGPEGSQAEEAWLFLKKLDLSFWLSKRTAFATTLNLRLPRLEAGPDAPFATALQDAWRCPGLLKLQLEVAGRLDQLPEEISTLQHLQELDVSAGHTLEPLPAWLHQLPRLELLSLDCSIQCGGVKASKVVAPQPPLPGVTCLHLSRLEVVDLSLLETFCSVRELRLHRVPNLLDRKPLPAPVLFELRSVSLTHCKLPSIPQALMGAVCLQELVLCNNQITFLPTWLARLPLCRLDLTSNHIKYLPRTLSKCSLLQHLSLAHNTQLQLHVFLAPGSFASGRLADAITLVQLLGQLHRLQVLDIRQPPHKFWSEQCHGALAKAQYAVASGGLASQRDLQILV